MASILVVDDEAALRAPLAAFLSKQGHNVVTAADGYEALARIQQEKIDLILTDLQMPNMTGVELIAAVRERGLSLPIIAMTGGGGRPGQLQPVHAMEAGAGTVLAKPFSLAHLVLAVEGLLQE